MTIHSRFHLHGRLAVTLALRGAVTLLALGTLPITPAGAQQETGDRPVTEAELEKNIGHTHHHHRHNDPHPTVTDVSRFVTSRAGRPLPLPAEEDAFTFAIFGDRTGGPAKGVSVLADAVRDVNLLEPDLVMTVGDLIEGYNTKEPWLAQMREYKHIMNKLICPWFPVAGNHDVYWRGPEGQRPEGEHEQRYEMHFGPLWYAFSHKNCWFIVLYSDEGDPATGKKTFREPDCQRMSPEQFAWLKETLARTEGADHVFLFLHHPRWLKGGYGGDWDHVHELLRKAGNVTAVFAGHIHMMRYDGPVDGIEYVTLATTGGHQSALIPSVGFLHHYHLVTVRKNQVAMASVPVGGVMDVREITGDLIEQASTLNRAPISVDGAVTVTRDGQASGVITVELTNTADRPIDATMYAESADSRWWFSHDHTHGTVEPGASMSFAMEAKRPAGSLDLAMRPAQVRVDIDYLAPGARYAIPERAVDIPMYFGDSLTPEPAEGKEFALALDGVDDHAYVPSNGLVLPDGPLTLECWMRAVSFAPRTGLVAKTESSEYGFFVNNGIPEFSIFLGGAYVTATADAPLPVERWHHLAGVFDGNEVRLYVDGTLAASAEGSGARRTNSLPLMIGADVNRNGEAVSPFTGAVDAVHLSKVARYDRATFTPRRRPTADGDSCLLLNMDGLLGPYLEDSSGHGAHGRVVGATVVETKVVELGTGGR